jgi:hypothetical protein
MNEQDQASEGFDGFITDDGERVSIHDVGRLCQILTARSGNAAEIARTLVVFARDCLKRGYYRTASLYLGRAFDLTNSPGEMAECQLMLGQSLEQPGDSRPQKGEIMAVLLEGISVIVRRPSNTR